MSRRKRDTEGMAVPRGRLSRMAGLGATALGIGANVLGAGLKSAASGQKPDWRGAALSPGNAARLTGELARMRGAAMKVGQLLSMDAGDLLPPEFASVLARLRADAHPMPPRQLRDVLDQNWGEGWYKRFARFDLRPLAAASIGQVHRAILPDGRDLAVKVQFPGVRESIESDVDNVTSLLKLSGLLPSGIELAPLMTEAKEQLHREADYIAEASALAAFNTYLDGDPRFILPRAHLDLTRQDVLAMDYLISKPLEVLQDEPQHVRDTVVTALFELLFREVFEFGSMQSDPNLANYRYDPETGRIVLLDFGAVRDIPKTLAQTYRAFFKAGASADRSGLRETAEVIGYISSRTPDDVTEALVDIMLEACEPLRAKDGFDFGQSDLALRLRDKGMELGFADGYREIPPVDVLYLHRKFGGLYLLARRLQARVDIAGLAQPHLD